MPDRIFGHVPGHPPGTWYASRRELYDAGVHRHLQAGIVGSQYEGADSIVLSGGYEDDDHAIDPEHLRYRRAQYLRARQP